MELLFFIGVDYISVLSKYSKSNSMVNKQLAPSYWLASSTRWCSYSGRW